MGQRNPELKSSLKLLVKSSVLVFIAVLLSKILTYVYRIIVARHYGPEVYGLLALSLMVFGWFALLSKLGLGEGILRYVSLYRGKRDDEKISYLVKRSLWTLFLTGIIFGILLFLFSDLIAQKIFNNSELSVFLKIFSLIIPLATLNTIFFSLMKAYEKIGWFSFTSKVLDNFVKLITLVVLIFLGADSLNVPISYAIGAGITLVTSYFFCKTVLRRAFKSRVIESKRAFRSMFSYSWPLIFFGFAVALLHQTDSFIIGIFRNVEEVGFYNAAIPIALLLTFSTDLFNQLFFPLVTKEYSRGNRETVRQLSKQVGKWIYMLSLPLFILFIIFPGFFIQLLFGEEYLIATNALRFLSIGAMFIAIFDVSKQLIAMKGKSKIILLDVIAVVSINLILNLILVPKHGINGAAFATMVSFIILGVIFAIQSKKYLSVIPLKRKMIRITFAALVSTGILTLIKNFMELNTLKIIIFGVLFLLIYLIFLFVLKCFDKNDKIILDLIKNKFGSKKRDAFNHVEIKRKDL